MRRSPRRAATVGKEEDKLRHKCLRRSCVFGHHEETKLTKPLNIIKDEEIISNQQQWVTVFKILLWSNTMWDLCFDMFGPTGLTQIPANLENHDNHPPMNPDRCGWNIFFLTLRPALRPMKIATLRESNVGMGNFLTMWGPPVISWFISPSNYSYLRTINHSYWSHKPTERYLGGLTLHDFHDFLSYWPPCVGDMSQPRLKRRMVRFLKKGRHWDFECLTSGSKQATWMRLKMGHLQISW